MENFKFGHRVLVLDKDGSKWRRGRYIFHYEDISHPHYVLVDDHGETDCFKHCRLDPDATEFLPGDEVEVRDLDHQEWRKTIYAGYIEGHEFPHFAKVIIGDGITFFKQCRYPQQSEQPTEQPEPAQTIELNGKRYEIREVK